MTDQEILGAAMAYTDKHGGGGGGGTNNYNELSNKPQIGGVTLSGNKSASDLGLADNTTVQGILDGQEIDSFGDVETALEGKQDALTAGDYIDITGSEVSVDRDLHGDVFTYIIEKYDSSNVQIIKKLGDVVMNTQIYNYSSPLLTVDDVFTIGGQVVQRFVYTITLLRASTTYPAGTSLNTGTAVNPNTITQDFEADLSGYKLVIKSEMDNALADKANASDVKKEFGGTLEEWNALSTEQKKEYDTYDITNDYSDANYIYLPTIYSEEEREVGVWKDGKPLYQKTIDFGALPNNTSKTVSSGLTGVSVKSIFGTAMASNGFTVTLPHAELSGTGSIDVSYLADNNVRISTDYNYSEYNSCVTLQYTKNSDTAGSGTWTPTGQYAEHYSTDEQIIGTWMGETLYRKVYNNIPLTDSTDFTVESNFSSTKNLVSVFAMGYAEGVGVKQAVPLSDFVSAGSLYAYPRILNNNLTMIINGDMSDFTANIIVEYTKAS